MPPRAALSFALLSAMLAAPSAPLLAQAAAPAPQRILGAVTAIQGNAVTVQPEGASAVTVQLTPQTRLLRTAPGETTLKNATPMQPADLAVGDRVLVRPTPDGAAALLIAMKQGDIAQHHQQESAAWQHGVFGIVQTAEAGAITLKAQGNAPPVVIHLTPATAVRRYAPDSTSFADTRKSTPAAIHPGDQVRARGTRGEAGIEADEVVAGSFRDIAGTVLSADPSAGALTLTNLVTKKPETLHLDPNTQMRKLPPDLAARLARKPTGEAHPDTGAEPPRSREAELLQSAPSISLTSKRAMPS